MSNKNLAISVPRYEAKFAPLGKDVSVDQHGEISGYASLFGVRDQGADVVQPGAYTKSLDAMKDSGRRVKMLWQHDPSQPIGVWDEVVEDEKGLFVKGRILPTIEKGREAISMIESGVIDGLSIGYRTVRASKDAKGNRQLIELDLWEVSLVTFPMLPSARVSNVKDAAYAASELKHFEAILREAGGFSNGEATAVVSGIVKLARGERGAKQATDEKAATALQSMIAGL